VLPDEVVKPPPVVPPLGGAVGVFLGGGVPGVLTGGRDVIGGGPGLLVVVG